MYPRWRIPNFDPLSLPKDSRIRLLHSLDKFNRLLEDKIVEYLNWTRSEMPDPSESIVFAPTAYTPSEISVLQGALQSVDNLEGADSLRKPSSGDILSDTANGNTNNLRVLNFEGLHALQPGQVINVHLSQGSSVRFHTRRIHMELSYEWASFICPKFPATTSSTQSKIRAKDMGLLVQVE